MYLSRDHIAATYWDGQALELDRTHPLFKDMLVCVTPFGGGTKEHVYNQLSSDLNAGSGVTYGLRGRALKSSAKHSVTVPSHPDAMWRFYDGTRAGGLTILSIAWFDTNLGGHHYGITGGGGGFRLRTTLWSGENSVNQTRGLWSGAGPLLANNIPRLQAGGVKILTMDFDGISSADARLYHDGILEEADLGAADFHANDALDSADVTVEINVDPDANHNFSLLMAFNRELTYGEVQLLSAYPFAMFKEATTGPLMAVTAAAGGPTFTKALAGAIDGAPSLATAATFRASLAGTIAATPSLTKRTRHALAATINGVPALVRKTRHALSGTFTGTPALSTRLIMRQALAGAISAAPSLATLKKVGAGLKFLRDVLRPVLRSVLRDVNRNGD